MEAYKHDLDLIFADIKESQEGILARPEVSQEYKDFIELFDRLETDEDYEYFMTEMMKNGEEIFNAIAMLGIVCNLTFQGKFELLESVKKMCNLYHSLNKIQV